MTKFLMLALIGAQAMAEGLPSYLPNGRYRVDCHSVSVSKFTPPQKDGDPAVTGKIVRRTGTGTGSAVFEGAGDVVTVSETANSKSQEIEATTTSSKSIKWKSLGDGRYEESIEGATASARLDNGTNDHETHETKIKMKRVVLVAGDLEIVESVQGEDGETAPSVREQMVTKNADGSYTIVAYNREPVSTDIGMDGVVLRRKQALQSISSCRYSREK